MAGSGGPWGGGGGNQDDDGREGRDEGRKGGPRRPGEGPQIPEIDELVRKGQEQLRVLMGGGGGKRPQGPGGSGGGAGGQGPNLFSKQGLVLGAFAAVALWGYASFYTVKPEEQSVELFLGEFSAIGNPGLNFAPWPLVSAEIVQVTG